MHFWQNNRGLLRATAVTRGLERTPNKSQHTNLTLEKIILPPLLPGFELVTFRSRIWRSNQQAIQAQRTPQIKSERLHYLKGSIKLFHNHFKYCHLIRWLSARCSKNEWWTDPWNAHVASLKKKTQKLSFSKRTLSNERSRRDEIKSIDWKSLS